MSEVGQAVSLGPVVGPIKSARDQKKASERAARRERKANRIEKARAEATRSIARRKARAQARQAQEFNLAAAEAQGISAGSSALQGAQGSLLSNLSTSLAGETRSFVSAGQSFGLRQQAQNILSKSRADAAIQQTVFDLYKQGARAATGAQ